MTNKKAYIIGGGLASLSAAFYLIKDGNFKGENIVIFEEREIAGGGLDAVFDSAKEGYFMRGFRMLEQYVYSAIFDLMSHVPSIENPEKSILDEFIEFNKKVKTYASARLIKNGIPINARPLKMVFADRVRLLKLLVTNELKLEKVRIDQYFSNSFFSSNLWYEFSTTFSFQPWHSVVEMKRYILRFIQDSHQMDTSECIRSTPLNQFESIVLPLKTLLKEKGVQFKNSSTVADIAVESGSGDSKKRIAKIAVRGAKKEEINIAENDFVFISNGSMVSSFSAGSMEEPPEIQIEKEDCSWSLWEKLAKISPQFGSPSVFKGDIDKSKWVAFTVTFKTPFFIEFIEKLTKRKAGTEGPVTVTDSNWFISFALPYSPHFKGQPENVNLLWGYGIKPDNLGNFVKKKMEDCSGKEILTELLHHLKIEKDFDNIMASSLCIPCFMPYITSQFMPRKQGDRPQIVPEISENFAFIGQFCEMDEDIVFTLDYSVRSAQAAVYKLLNIDKKPTKIYKGYRNPLIVLRTIRTVFR
ncbi:MAG: oleate hydratase [bacterium]